MIALSYAELAQITGGRWLRPELTAAGGSVAAVSTDSRTLTGGLFVAIVGKQFDGNRYANAAAARGAQALLLSAVEHVDAAVAAKIPVLHVADTERALGQLASAVRQRAACSVIAVVGSNGKTTTKDMIAHVLGTRLRVAASPKSFNNSIGVPLAIFQLTGAEPYAILELGANHAGEIAALSAMTRPDMAVVTSIGRDHLEFFGSLKGVIDANAEALQGMPEDGILFVNGDDSGCLEIAERARCRVRLYGFSPSCDIRAEQFEQTAEGIAFTIRNRRIESPVFGRHNASNALAAAAVALHCGLDLPVIARALRGFRSPELRLQVAERGGIHVLNDSYNANPESMRAALRTLADFPRAQSRVAVLGEMLELGQRSREYHVEIASYAASLKLDGLIAVGPHARDMAYAARTLPFALAAGGKDEALAMLRERLAPGMAVLVKGSRGARMETIAEDLLRQAGPAGSPDKHPCSTI